MSYESLKKGGKKLLKLADKRLHEMKIPNYLGDEHFRRNPFSSTGHSCGKIRDFLKDIQDGRGDIAALLADCQNHLRAMYARLAADDAVLARVVRVNNVGLFIVQDIRSGKQHCFMNERTRGLWNYEVGKATVSVGKLVVITLLSDGKVDTAIPA